MMTEIAAITAVVAAAIFLFYLSYRGGRSHVSPSNAPLVLILIVLILGASFTLIWADRPDFPAVAVTGLLVAGSALFGLLFNASVARGTEARRRAEKRRDMRRALIAEIEDYVLELEQAADLRTPDRIEAAFDSEANFVPFLTAPRRDRVFSTVLEQIEALDDAQVETVVRFYALHDKVIELVTRMQSADYRMLPKARRKAVLLSANELETTLIRYGRDAIVELKKEAGTAPTELGPRPDLRQSRFNRTGRARSSPGEAASE